MAWVLTKVSEIKPGDHILWYQCKVKINAIVPVPNRQDGVVVLKTDWANHSRYDRATGRIATEQFYRPETQVYIWRDRPCAPCYDSDCECIFDVLITDG